MQVDRRWIYTGLTALGFGLMQAGKFPKVRAGDRLLLLGEHGGLFPLVSALARDAGIRVKNALAVQAEVLTDFRPRVTVMMLPERLEGLAMLLDCSSTELVCVVGPLEQPRRIAEEIFRDPTGRVVYFPSHLFGVKPTVRGYAGWAGALWQWLT